MAGSALARLAQTPCFPPCNRATRISAPVRRVIHLSSAAAYRARARADDGSTNRSAPTFRALAKKRCSTCVITLEEHPDCAPLNCASQQLACRAAADAPPGTLRQDGPLCLVACRRTGKSGLQRTPAEFVVMLGTFPASYSSKAALGSKPSPPDPWMPVAATRTARLRTAATRPAPVLS